MAEIEALPRHQDTPLAHLYEFAAAKNANRRRSLYEKLKSDYGDPPPAVDKVKAEDTEDELTEPELWEELKKEGGAHQDIDAGELWEALKKVSRKDKRLLLNYVSSKKAAKLLEEYGDNRTCGFPPKK